MILIDPRDGSKELVKPLRARGLSVNDDDYIETDVMFEGRGVGGRPLLVGIEYKKLSDLMSSMRNNRLNAQNETMVNAGIDVRLLFIEGPRVINEHGQFCKRVGKVKWVPMPGIGHGELMKRLWTLQFCTGLTWHWFDKQDQVVREIELLYRNWTDKDLDKHDSHLQPYEPGKIVPVGRRRRTLMTFPGVAKEWSKVAVEEFGSVRKAVAQGPKGWAELEANGRHFGPTMAQKVQEFLDSTED